MTLVDSGDGDGDGIGDGTDGDGMAIMMRVSITCDGGGLFNQLLG